MKDEKTKNEAEPNEKPSILSIHIILNLSFCLFIIACMIECFSKRKAEIEAKLETNQSFVMDENDEWNANKYFAEVVVYYVSSTILITQINRSKTSEKIKVVGVVFNILIFLFMLTYIVVLIGVCKKENSPTLLFYYTYGCYFSTCHLLAIVLLWTTGVFLELYTEYQEWHRNLNQVKNDQTYSTSRKLKVPLLNELKV